VIEAKDINQPTNQTNQRHAPSFSAYTSGFRRVVTTHYHKKHKEYSRTVVNVNKLNKFM